MLTEKKNTLHTHPSLLPLRTALSLAEREAPARPQRTRVDTNEQRALQLIEKVKAEYKKPLSFLKRSDIPVQHGQHKSLRETVVTHA